MQFRNETNILYEMVEHAMQEGLLGTDADVLERVQAGELLDNQYILDLAVHARVLSQVEDIANTVYQDINVLTASGEALDNLGRLVGVSRYAAQAPIVDVTLTLELGATEDVNVPAGTPLVISAGQADNLYGEYVTSESVTLHEGTTSTSVRCECIDLGYHQQLPVNAVTGLEGFDFSVTSTLGTSGRNIEEDEDYRLRIMQWSAKYLVGTRACLEDYLSHYSGLDSWCLVPRYDGVGTLKIVCDTLESELQNIADGVTENCMLVTDYPCVCVLPVDETLASLELECHKTVGMVSNMTDDELTQLITAQVFAFVDGGFNRSGFAQEALAIGADFNPSQLISYLLANVPEIDNIILNENDVISVADTHRFKIEEVEVTLV